MTRCSDFGNNNVAVQPAIYVRWVSFDSNLKRDVANSLNELRIILFLYTRTRNEN